MQPRFAFYSISRASRLRAPSRCQFVWQFVLLLATLGFALVSGEIAHGAEQAVSPRHQICLAAHANGRTEAVDQMLGRLRLGSTQRESVLNRILDTRESLVRQDLSRSRAFLNCLERPSQTTVCQEARRQVQTLDEKAKMARLLLAASQSQYQRDTWRGRARHDVNGHLDTLGSYKISRWKTLNASERAFAQEALDVIESDLKLELPGAQNFQARERRLIEARFAYFVDYLQIMSQSSLLQWIKDDYVNTQNFKAALLQAIRMSERDLRSIAEQRAMIHFNRLRMETHSRANDPVLYATIVNAMALESEPMCLGLLIMKKEFERAQFEDQLAIMIGGLPFMFMAGPAALVTMTAAGGAYLGQSQARYMDTQSRELGVAFVDWNEINLKSLRADRRMRDIDAISIGIGMPLMRGGRLIFRTSRATLKTLNHNRSVLLKRILESR